MRVQATGERIANNLLNSSIAFRWSDVYDDPNCKNPITSAWCAANVDDPTSYLIADLGSAFYIDSVSTWGETTWFDYVKQYNFSFSLDDILYSSYHGNPIQGNVNYYDEKRHIFENPIIARYLKFIPIDWHEWKSVTCYPIFPI